MCAEPGQIACVASGVYFGANDGTNGAEVWRIVGGSLVVLFANLQPGAGQSLPEEFTSFGDRVVFSASGPSGREAYVITPGGLSTTLVDIRPGSGSSSPSHFVGVQLSATQAWFYCQADANNGMGRELWRYNAVTPGLSPIDLAPGATSSSPVATLLGTNLVVHPTGTAGLFGLPVGSISPVVLLSTSTFPLGLAFTSPPTLLCLEVTTGQSWRTNGTIAGTSTGGLPGGFGLFSSPVLTLPGWHQVPDAQWGRADQHVAGDHHRIARARRHQRRLRGARPRRDARWCRGVRDEVRCASQRRNHGRHVPDRPANRQRRARVQPAVPRGAATTSGRDLHATDGTAAGTVLVQANATPDTNDVAWAIAGAQLVVFRDGRVLASSTTNLQPLLTLGLAVAPRPAQLGTVVIYFGDSATGGSEPWRTGWHGRGHLAGAGRQPGRGILGSGQLPSDLRADRVGSPGVPRLHADRRARAVAHRWHTRRHVPDHRPRSAGSSGVVPDLVAATGTTRVVRWVRAGGRGDAVDHRW